VAGTTNSIFSMRVEQMSCLARHSSQITINALEQWNEYCEAFQEAIEVSVIEVYERHTEKNKFKLLRNNRVTKKMLKEIQANCFSDITFIVGDAVAEVLGSGDDLKLRDLMNDGSL